MSGPSVRELSGVTDPTINQLIGALRRMVIKVTSRALWQVVGYRIGSKTETIPAEPFSGIGFYSRPSASGKPEAIAAFIGGANSPAIIALRDEKTRAAVAGGLAEDETAVFNSRAILVVKASGAVEVRSAGGVAVPLATKADIDALTSWLAGLTLPVTTNGTAVTQAGWAGPPPAAPLPPVDPIPAISGAPPSATGTTVLKGQ